jgi:hypothetical protein
MAESSSRNEGVAPFADFNERAVIFDNAIDSDSIGARKSLNEIKPLADFQDTAQPIAMLRDDLLLRLSMLAEVNHRTASAELCIAVEEYLKKHAARTEGES